MPNQGRKRLTSVARFEHDGDICVFFENPPKSTSDEGRALDQYHTELHTGGVVSVSDVRLQEKVAGGAGV